MTTDGHFHTRTYLPEDVVLAFEHKPREPEKHPFARIHEFYLLEVRGAEALSSLYEYDVFLEGPADAVPSRAEVGELLHARAYFAWGPHDENPQAVLPTWGALRGFALESVHHRPTEKGGGFWARLKLTLRPSLWDLSQVHRTGIFHEQSTLEIVTALLQGHKPPVTRHRVEGLRKPPPAREYTVQYQESDLDFASRLLEHEGIFYYFTHDEGGDTVVFGDANSALLGASESTRRQLRWDYDGESGRAENGVAALSWRDRTAPGSVRMRDYDYRQASAEMSGEAKVDAAHALGSHAYFGEHFRTAAEARRIATARVEALWSEHLELEGTSYAKMLRPGERVQLDAHPVGADFDCTEWLVTRVRHSLVQGGDGAAESSARRAALGVVARTGYENTFTAVPLREKSAYRPARRTPKPRIYGLMTATVEGAETDMTTPLDAEGRYRVNFPWPSHGLVTAGPSRWVRRAQLANGPDYGTHYPIHGGTEVLVAHLDGDPDRPVIVGSVPNSEGKSPVTSENSTQAIFRTRAGVAVIVEDHTG